MGKLLCRPVVAIFVLCLLLTTMIASAQPQRPQRPVQTTDDQSPEVQAQAGYRLSLELREGQTVRTLSRRAPKSLPYYTCSVDLATANKMCDALQRLLDIKGNRVKDEDGDESVMDNKREVELIGASGSVFAADLNRLWQDFPDVGTEGAIGEQEARQAAIRMLKQIGAPLGDDYDVKVSRDTAILTDREGRSQNIPGPVQVSVRPKVYGLPVVGAGGKLKVYFDNKGKIAGCLVVKRRLAKSDAPRDLLPLSTALRRLAGGEAMNALRLDTPQRIVIKDISLAYFAKSASEKQAYLQPVYVFSGTAYGAADGEDWETPYQGYIPALAKPLESLWEPQDDSAGALKVDRTSTAPAEGDE